MASVWHHGLFSAQRCTRCACCINWKLCNIENLKLCITRQCYSINVEHDLGHKGTNKGEAGATVKINDKEHEKVQKEIFNTF